jgi:protein-L-isoaspartate(D-aspartate) O-methyltransferase
MSATLEIAREQMIEQQVHAWQVFDERVLDAMRTVRREQFAPQRFGMLALADTGIPIGHGQSMLAPKLDGRILEALAIKPTDMALDVGTGSGFLAACMGRLAARVQSLEIFDDLASRARASLVSHASNNVAVETVDAFQWSAGPDYDVIAVTGSLPVYDVRFERWLKVGGRLFVVIGEAPVMQAQLITRTSERDWSTTTLFETSIEPLMNAARPSQFLL